MKRGQVVDAETAEKITSELQHLDENLRPVIWPAVEADKAEGESWEITLEGFPIHRPLLHLVCGEEDIFCLSSIPVRSGNQYFVMTGVRHASYDGDIDDEVEMPMFWTQSKMLARQKRKLVEVAHRKWIFSIEEIIDKCENGTITAGEQNCISRIAMACRYEEHAFSPYATIRQRPMRKQLVSPIPRQWPMIEIVNLRLPEKKENGQTTGRSINLRFPVIGHMRRQPTKEGIKLIEIAPHWRGPEHAPVKPKIPKVYKVIK